MNYRSIGTILSIIASISLIFISLVFILNTTELNTNSIKAEVWGQYGDIVGGFVGTLVAFVGVLMLFETFREQRNIFLKQQVETRFFELIRLHKENVNEMRSRGKQGRSVFIGLRDEMIQLIKDIKDRYPQNAQMDGKNSNTAEWHKEIVQIAYMILFYGVNNSNDEESSRKIMEITKQRGNGKAIEDYFKDLVIKHSAIKSANTESDDRGWKVKKYLKYDGQQSRLAHYFRHLYQTVKYINQQPTNLFNYKEKTQYITILKSQLSTHEQALLFFDSLFQNGMSWELSKSDVDDKLITKYNMIRNMPREFTGLVDPKHFYPDVNFEYDPNLTNNRKLLIRLYK